ncbi:type II secretion system protein GspM [Gilvimarinus japonicus]|uniref:Type II secretion system protein GspM n=1 Tax=Gilvimarinus japonicus TaxID=1796469 RepID=A0ABV7HSN6_9GAMM
MNLKNLSKAQWVVAVTVASVLFVFLWSILALLWSFGAYNQQAQEIKPKIARLSGLLQTEGQMREANAQAAAELSAIAYGAGEDDNALSTAMQQAVRSVFTAAELTVTGSQIIKPKKVDGFVRVGVSLTARGSVESLVAVVSRIHELQPLVLIERLELKPQRARRGSNIGQQLEIRMQLVSMKERRND